MDPLRWSRRPKLRHPLMLVAFAGWNDDADAATAAVDYLGRTWSARPFADIDPEEFFDFTVARPTIRLVDGVTRQLQWPTTTLSAAPVPGRRRDVVLLRGTEPGLRWRGFCQAVVGAAVELGVELVLALGSVRAEVPHTRPVRVTGTATDPAIVTRLGFRQSLYEGPVGLIAVLHDALARASIPSASLWANVPHYVAQNPSPKATLALVERAASLLGARVDAVDLQIATSTYERQISELVEADEEAAAYVARLEEADEDDDLGAVLEGELPSGDDLAAEVTQFLRGHRSD